MLHVETKLGYENLDEILAVDCIDGIFFGAADLAASYGLLGQSNHPSIVEAIEVGLRKTRATGMSGGVLCGDRTIVQRYFEAGARFIAVGVDALLLTAATTELRQEYKPETSAKSITDY